LAGVGEYTGSGKDDLLWRNASTGAFSVWQSTGTGFTPNVLTGNVDPTWNLVANPTQHVFG
jgi:hypothetical protein